MRRSTVILVDSDASLRVVRALQRYRVVRGIALVFGQTQHWGGGIVAIGVIA
jgi:hypothetical protein